MSRSSTGRGRPHNRTGLLRSELGLLFVRTRNRVLLVALALIPVAIAIVVRVFTAPGAGEGPPFLASVTENGLFVAFTGLAVTLPLFLPLAIGVVAGDSVAGEAGMGTLRYLLVVPAGRGRLLAVKLASIVVFSVAAAAVVAIAGMAIGAILFPLGPVTLLSGDTISSADAALRALYILLYVGGSLCGLGAIGLFVSTLTDVPIAAMATTVALAIGSEIADSIPQLHVVAPWLFTHYWLSFGDLLRQPIYTTAITKGLLLQLAYVVVFGAAAWARFTTRDVLS